MNLIIKKNHNISQKKISRNAMKVLYRLNKLGYEAYLVGGGVRDLLLGKKPKDFDIATNARPSEIRKLFKNCRLIGRRFIIAHLIFKSEIIEVSTFRAHNRNIENKLLYNYSRKKKNRILLLNNTFGKIEEDAYRRDLTVNALYYSIQDFGIRDYVGGIKDIKSKQIRLIGNAEKRYKEDPVRMLRVIRFSVRLRMNIDKKTEKPIIQLSHLLKKIPSARLFNESIKLFCFGHGYLTYIQLQKYYLISFLLPFLCKTLSKKNSIFLKNIIIYGLKKIDSSMKIRCPSFLFSLFLWYPLTDNIKILSTKTTLNYFKIYSLSMHYILKKYSISIGIPKNISLKIEKIWNLQIEIEKIKKNKTKKIIKNNIFYYSLELLYLRSKIENQIKLKRIILSLNKKYIFS